MIRREEQIGDCTLYLGDCREILPDIGGVIVTDPPYGIGFDYDEYEDTSAALVSALQLFRNRPTALLQYPEEMMRLVVPVLGAPSEVMSWNYGSNLPRQFRLWGFWGCDVDPKRSKQPARNPEVSKVKNLMVAGYDWREFPQVKNTSREKTAHPCQLPLSVARWILECLDAPKICDPFMGSGTIGIAAAEAGRKFTGIEISESYFEIAVERLRAFYAQADLLAVSA